MKDKDIFTQKVKPQILISILKYHLNFLLLQNITDDEKKDYQYSNDYFRNESLRVTRSIEFLINLQFLNNNLINELYFNDNNEDLIENFINVISNNEIENLSFYIVKDKDKNYLKYKNKNVSTLGMLVCGDDPFHFLGSRVEVNCYYDTSIDIGKDKKIFRNDVINLMEDTFRYIWGHIKINRTIREGGKSEPEYPEKLIRETINNALAHRDYTIDNFVTVTIEPNQYIEIKNPGSFKEKIKLIHTETEIAVRRLIPGIPESKNPKLASVLKVFDKIESQGRGMASLVNAALDNQIDLPTYEIKDGLIALKISTGKLVDESIETWLDGFKAYLISKLKTEITFEHKAVLAYFYKSELVNRQRLFSILLTESNNHFIVIEALKKANLIVEHVASTDENPIYVLDRVLLKIDFTDELITKLGTEYIHYDDAVKQVLNLIYLFSKYNNKSLKAAEITPEVYRRIYGKEIVGKTYETLGRKVRNICNKFEKQGILTKGSKNDYSFNFDYTAENLLF